jgi:phosphate uptake regulator
MNDLNKGDNVSLLIQSNGSLIINPFEITTEKKKEIHIGIGKEEENDSIIRRLIASYLDGYDLIKLTSEENFSAEQHRTIRKIASILYMMIIDSKSNSIVLQTLMDESQASFHSAVQRMHIITHSMCQEIIVSMKKWDKHLLESVIPLEEDVDQLMFLNLRLIRSAASNPSLANELDLDMLDCLDFQSLIHRIERIADHNSIIVENLAALIESEVEIPNPIISILIEAAEIAFSSYNDAVHCFLEKNILPTDKIIGKQQEIINLYGRIFPLPPMPNYALSNIINIRESVKKISHYVANIAELTINRTYNQ